MSGEYDDQGFQYVGGRDEWWEKGLPHRTPAPGQYDYHRPAAVHAHN